VARQYTGTAGRIENAQVGVFVAYASEKGAAFVDRALYLPREEWANDPLRREKAGVPDEVRFATKGELTKGMLRRAFEAKVPARWVVADSVYGTARGLLDKDIPIAQARQIAERLAQCRAAYYPDEGHISVIVNHQEDIVKALLSRMFNKSEFGKDRACPKVANSASPM
jgi:DDE superfamily endonuclease